MRRQGIRSNRSIAFERSYLTALEEHVRMPRGAGAGDRIGQRARELGVETLTLARIHDRCAAALAPPDGRARRHRSTSTVREETFFAEAVAPIEAAHRGGSATAGKSRKLAAQLHRRTSQLTEARSHLKALRTELNTSARHAREQLERSRLMEQQLRRLSHKLLSAQEEERLRISRNLHDAIGQTLTGINVGLATLKHEAAAESRTLAASVTQAQQLVERSMKTVHQFAWELRPTLLDDLGLVPALRSYANSFSKRTGVLVRFAADSKFGQLSDDRRTALFRVAQGALSNVERHARAAHARLTLSSLPGVARLEVKDNGRSFDVRRMETSRTNKHLGLLVMRERVEMVGGSFSIESSPGRGTLVRVDLPLEKVTRV